MDEPLDEYTLSEAVASLFEKSRHLRRLFPGRPFTLDGHIIGSIGEAVAQKFFGITLAPPSSEAIDGWFGSNPVQIKTTTGRTVSFISEGRNQIQPDFLLVFHVSRAGVISLIYNGPYNAVIEQLPPRVQRNGQRQIVTSRLMDLDFLVPPEERIPQLRGQTIWPYRTSTAFRRELIYRARAFAIHKDFRFYESSGLDRVVCFERVTGNTSLHHGNFDPDSFGMIHNNAEWSNRLQKSHSQKRFLPVEKRGFAKELDSCCSSDALLMNIFCHPEITENPALARMLGFSSLPDPQFGYDPGLLKSGRKEPSATEVDMVLRDQTRTLLCEAKLTEPGLQTHDMNDVERYDLFESTFNKRILPVDQANKLHGFQLVRNVIAARLNDASFCLIYDARRGDLEEEWQDILECVLDDDLRSRCFRITWQQIAFCCPKSLQRFLNEKYGIVGSSV